MIDPVEASHMVGLPARPPPLPTFVGYILEIPDRKRPWLHVDRVLVEPDALHLQDAYKDCRHFKLDDVDDGADTWVVEGWSRSWPPDAEERDLVGAVDFVERFRVVRVT